MQIEVPEDDVFVSVLLPTGLPEALDRLIHVAFHPVAAFGLRVIARAGTGSAVNRRHGLFPYTLMFKGDGFSALIARCRAHADAARFNLTPDETISVVLAEYSKDRQPWMALVQFLSLKAERSQRKGDRQQAAWLREQARLINRTREAETELVKRRAQRLTIH